MSWQRRRTDRRRRRFFVELLEDRRLLAGVISQVGYFDTWDGGVIRSTDVAGVAYHPSGHLYLADSEINEISAIFNGDNIFETSLNGDFVHRGIASGNTEPTGITFNEFDGYFYVSNDTGNKHVTRYDSNLNNSLYEFAPQNNVPNASDPEGITSDPSTGFLYVVDGHDGGRQVLIYSLDLTNQNAATRGVNFEGVFSVAAQMGDAEGIAFHEPSGHLFLIDGNQEIIFEYTTDGIFVEQYDISGFSPAPSAAQGLTFGPTSDPSDHPNALSLYIADGGSDNYPDGGVYEAVVGTADIGTTLLNIRVMGDVPYTPAEYATLEEDLSNVGPTDEFFVHLGDIQSEGACDSSTYSNVANTLQTSSIPVFIVPGDNEYNDCPDPDLAWTYWESSLLRLEENWSNSFAVTRQSIREENFAIVHEGVLFIGINLVGGNVHDASEWSQRMTDNAIWVNENFSNFGSEVTSSLVFGHAFPNPAGGDRQQFGQDFVTAAQNFGKPILYMMGDEHGWLMDHPFSGAPNVTRVIVDQGPSVRVRISDHATNPFSFSSPEVSPGINHPPTLAAIGNRSVDEGSLLTFAASATDPDAPFDDLYFSLDAGAPPGATIHPITGQFSWTPPVGSAPASHTVTVRVSDDRAPNLSDFETVTITVQEINRAPVLAPIGNKSVDEGTLLTFAASATDSNNPANNLSFSLGSGAPAGATIHPVTGQFRWTPPAGTSPGDRTVTVRVTDDGVPNLQDFETITITVIDVNQPPVLAAIGTQSTEDNIPLTFTATATDPDQPANSFFFSLDSDAPVGATIDPSTGEFSWTPPAGTAPAIRTVTVRVTDDGTPSRDDFETIDIKVREANRPPVLATIGNRNIDEGSLLTFTATATDPNTLDDLSFSLDSGSPVGATIDPSTGQFRWRPPGGTPPGNHTVTVRVGDDRVPSLEDFETITITVIDVNLPPVLAEIGAQSVDEGSPLTFTASASDPDLPADNLIFSLDSGAPVGATINPNTGVFDWTPSEAEGPGVYSVTVRVTDDGTPTLDDFETINITVREVNLPPVLSEIGDQSIDEGSLLTFTASATDDDLPENNLFFSLDAGAPTGATINPTTGQFNWTPAEGAGPGLYTLRVRVTDNGTPSLEDFETINIAVGEINQAPELAAIDDKNVDEGSLLTFTASATDSDLPANNLSFSLDAGAPLGATIHPSTGQFSWTPPGGTSPGIHTLTVRVSDDGAPGLDDFQTVTITVNDVNQPPALAAIGAQNVEEGSQLAFTASATDVDLPGDNLSFSLDSGAPAGATINPSTGEFIWTPGEAEGPAVYTVTVRVSDNGVPNLDDFETIIITVDEVNQAPQLAAIGNKSVDEASLLTFTASATDADLPANNLSFRLDAGAPLGASIDPSTGQFSWTPPGGTSPGVHTVTVRVSDDGVPSLDDFETITITVNDVNLPPVLAAIGSQSVDEGTALTFTASATDVDLPPDTLSFSLDADAPAGAIINSNTGEFRWTPAEADGPDVYTVTVRVTDDGTPNQTDFETITITVGEVNQAPVLAPISNMSVDEGNLVILRASAFDLDFPANNLSFTLDSDAPDGATIHPSTGILRWTPTEAAGPGEYSLTVRVTDDGIPSLNDVRTFDVTVGEVNQAPELAAIGNKNVDEGNLLTFLASVTDLDLPANNITFTLDAGAPVGASINPSTGEFRWKPREVDGPGVYSVTVRVTDDGSPSLEDFETITVTVSEVNQAPVLAPIGDKYVDEGSVLSFTASATDPDFPANNVSFRLDSDAPLGANIDPSTGEFRWTPSEAVGPGVYPLTVRVSDNGSPSLDDFETINITVGEINRAPVLAPIGNKNVDEGSLLSFTASATDPDLPANNISYSLDAGAPLGATINPSTGQFRWTPPGGTSPGIHTVTVRVNDNGVPGLEDFETITITVNDVNLPPVLGAIGAQNVAERSLLTFTAWAIDADLPADNLSFSLDAGAPAGATIHPTTGEFNWMPGELDRPAAHAVTVRVTDNGTPNLEDFETFNIAVYEVNQPPVLAAIGDKNVNEGSLLTFTATAVDQNLPTNNLFFSLDAGAPAGATIDPSTGQFRWMPPGGTSLGNHTVTVRVSDDGEPNLEDFETITIAVNDVNLPPTLAAIGAQNVEEGSPLTFMASATDPDIPADNLSFSLDAGAPSGATINPITGEFSWTPGEAHGSALFSVTVRVSDDGTPKLQDFETINITVHEANQAPVLAAIGNKSINEGRRLTFTALATDADFPVNDLTFSLDAGAPSGATIDPSSGLFSWTPPVGTLPGDHTVTVRVGDDGIPSREDFETITITVIDVNLPPVLAEIGAQSVDEESLLSFTASASDPDLTDDLFFSLGIGAPVGATIDPITGEFRWTPTEAQGPAVYSVNLRVSDDGTPSMDDFETINITVGEVNQAPVFEAIGNKHINEGSPITFTASATDADLPANNLTFSLAANAPPGATINPSTGRFSWTPPLGMSPGDYTVTIRVTDDGVPSRTASVLVVFSADPIPDINVMGNGRSIVDGDNTPDLLDHTDFGALKVGSEVLTRTYRIENLGTATLNLTGSPRVEISGADAADFTVTLQPPETIGLGEGSDFIVEFNPGAEGLRTATISIQNNEDDESIYEFNIHGTGTRNPLDVNRDGRVSALDALAIINQINRMLANQESAAESVDQALFDYDANGDGHVSALDALTVINHISAKAADGEFVVDGVAQRREAATSTLKSSLDDDLIRVLADDNIIAGLSQH